VRLTEEVHTLGAGGAAREIPVRRSDEIGRLAAAFNRMLAALAEREREKERAEARLRAAQRMEAVGTLARGIAHDFGNILSTVTGTVYLLQQDNAGNPAVTGAARDIRTALGRARELIERLVTFSRTAEARLVPLELGSLVAGLEPMLRLAAGGGVDLVVSLPPGELRIAGDAEGLRQVLLNLCYNARDAMEGKGRIRIALGLAVDGGRPPAARLTVQDDGPGMDEEVRRRLFDPFFTTKEVGRGTGLGLTIVHGVVEQHGGRIEVESEPGSGALFRIDLPLLAG
jgi:signal transduction histidine kinase